MYHRAANSQLFSVLLSSRVKYQRPDAPLALAIAGHAVLIAVAFWAVRPPLPEDVEPVDNVAFASGDSVTNVMLIAQDVAPELFKTQMKSATRHISARIPNGTLPTISDEGVSHAISAAVDSLKRALWGFAWAMPALPRRDTVTAAADVDELSSGPRYTAFTRAPSLRNIEQIQAHLGRTFPKKLRREGGDARSILWLLIDAGGEVRKALVRQSSGRMEVDSAALGATSLMRFEPAQQAGRQVPVWIQLPVRFRVQDISVAF